MVISGVGLALFGDALDGLFGLLDGYALADHDVEALGTKRSVTS